ncbi:MAG: squalene--hopene cyclase [Bacteroidales bacterium]|nr:squalene--hopene cyclase [Bacteroidales bacterium]
MEHLNSLFETLHHARTTLRAARHPLGHWEGELSSSALSTAIAVFTLSQRLKAMSPGAHFHHQQQIKKGLEWLVAHQNEDGGWGDTVLSHSNISTTALCWATLHIPEAGHHDVIATGTVNRAEVWLRTAAGGLAPHQLSRAIVRRYGKDRTFSVPILTMLALAGRLGPNGWRLVPQLPFELAACPFRWFQWLQLPVVSYALPALIAIGQVRHHFRPSWFLVSRFLRHMIGPRTTRLLQEIQPTTGGFLEAAPLTGFVAMSLIASGQVEHPVVQNAIRFLEQSVREDGSWPIDTNLATWVTTLSINALGSDTFTQDERVELQHWILQQQYQTEHPYTRAAPGGWAWTPLSGGVPDADDTPSAMLALATLGHTEPMGQPDSLSQRVAVAATWLLNLQNRDGGIPTFCRGWTGLPFDRSSADLTAHTLRAWAAWYPQLEPTIRGRMKEAIPKAVRFLMREQRSDGAWAPLWFGTQHVPEPDVANLTYGTSRVVRLLGVDLPGLPNDWEESLGRGVAWLVQAQLPNGGWGGRSGTPANPASPASIEETALALDALAAAPRTDTVQQAIARGVHWLSQATNSGTQFPPAPIGFYFANLWYFEKLYPLIFTVSALTRLAASHKAEPMSPSPLTP